MTELMTLKGENMPIQIGDIKLYSLLELSEPLKITTVTLRAYISQGKLKAQKAGGKWYVSEERLREFFNALPRKEDERFDAGL
jgi:hypothetical protein